MLTPSEPPVEYTTLQWCDAFQVHLECIAEGFGNKVKLETLIGDRLSGPTFDVERYREVMACWKRVRAKILGCNLNINQLDFEGAAYNTLGQLRPTGLLRLYPDDRARIAIEFSSDETWVAVAFVGWYLEVSSVNTDPRLLVRQTLERQGITEDNFDQHRNKLLISNPWKD